MAVLELDLEDRIRLGFLNDAIDAHRFFLRHTLFHLPFARPDNQPHDRYFNTGIPISSQLLLSHSFPADVILNVVKNLFTHSQILHYIQNDIRYP